MAETLLEYQTHVIGPDSSAYLARACGAPADGLWQAWLEFTPTDGAPTVRSGRETTQPNRSDAVYWATGLTPVYLEGALVRALEGPPRAHVPSRPEPPVFDGPKPSVNQPSADGGARGHAVLNPFSVYQKGEAMLRRQLDALSSWHLVNIISDYDLSEESMGVLNQRSHAALADIIVAAAAGASRLKSTR